MKLSLVPVLMSSPVVPAGGFAMIWQPRKTCLRTRLHGAIDGYAMIARSSSVSRFKRGGPMRMIVSPAELQKQS
jgi:hypothetical protein